MKVFNLYNDDLDNSNEREGWNFRAAKVGEHIGGELSASKRLRQMPWLARVQERRLTVLAGRT